MHLRLYEYLILNLSFEIEPPVPLLVQVALQRLDLPLECLDSLVRLRLLRLGLDEP
jgi:hypothetical protein